MITLVKLHEISSESPDNVEDLIANITSPKVAAFVSLHSRGKFVTPNDSMYRRHRMTNIDGKNPVQKVADQPGGSAQLYDNGTLAVFLPYRTAAHLIIPN